MTLSPDKNSGRSKRKATRNFTGSRPQRRAEARTAFANGAYEAAKKVDPNSGKGFTVPGAVNHW